MHEEVTGSEQTWHLLHMSEELNPILNPERVRQILEPTPFAAVSSENKEAFSGPKERSNALQEHRVTLSRLEES
jgi:hypothetical protein